MEDVALGTLVERSPREVIATFWEGSAKNALALHYVLGMIDAFRCAGVIDLTEYNELYDTYL